MCRENEDGARVPKSLPTALSRPNPYDTQPYRGCKTERRMTRQRPADTTEAAGDKPPEGGIGFPDIEGDRAAGDYRIGFRTGFTDGYADGLFAGGNK